MSTITLNGAQETAVRSDSNLILCLAGPGSGKTRTLVERITRLCNDELATPSQIVAITFTNAAAAELEHRVARAFGWDVRLGYVGTLHGLMLTLVQQRAMELGYASSRLVVLDADQAKELLDRTIIELNYRGPRKAVTEAIPKVV